MSTEVIHLCLTCSQSPGMVTGLRHIPVPKGQKIQKWNPDRKINGRKNPGVNKEKLSTVNERSSPFFSSNYRQFWSKVAQTASRQAIEGKLLPELLLLLSEFVSKNIPPTNSRKKSFALYILQQLTDWPAEEGNLYPQIKKKRNKKSFSFFLDPSIFPTFCVS